MSRPRLFAAVVAVPILIAACFARWQQAGDVDGVLFEDPNAYGLSLIQTHAKVISVSKKTSIQNSTKDAARKAAGIQKDGVGALNIFTQSIVFDAIVVCLCLAFFKFALSRYPIMLMYKVLSRKAPSEVPAGFFGWAHASWKVDVESAWNVSSLDHAMMLEYLNLSMTCFKWLSVPLFCITGPLNWWFGGNAAGQDNLSYFDIGNVEWGSWLYWITAACSWWVGVNVTRSCHNGMKKFMPLRQEWNRTLPELRGNTLLMLGIPEEYCSDEACKAFWENIFPGGRVKAVHITKETTPRNEWLKAGTSLRELASFVSSADLEGLKSLSDELAEQRSRLRLAEQALAKNPTNRPMVRPSTCGGNEVDAIDYHTAQVASLQTRVAKEREHTLKEAGEVGGVNLSTGFVTFEERLDAENAVRKDLSLDSNSWVLSRAPAPMDVIWADMTQNPIYEPWRYVVGYGLIAFIVIVYLPAVAWMYQVADAVALGPLQPLWAGEAPSIGLTILIDFLPAALLWIFTNFFSLYDKTQAQFKLSVLYWWLNVLYVVVVTSVGTNFTEIVETLSNDPKHIFVVLANTLPRCTNFYLNYIGLQAITQGLALTRYFYVAKFVYYSRTYDEEDAKNLAEPEAQDYYGIGARTARWSTMACIGICFGTLSPPVSMLTWMYMTFLRLVYGYLFCYAESRKSDSGGTFFHRALHNMFISLHIYMIIMFGVLFKRGPTIFPAVMVLAAWVYVCESHRRFSTYQWERVPYPVLMNVAGHRPSQLREKTILGGTYEQPELAQ